MPRFAPGDKIGGQYEVLSLLGTGGMSDVYRCDDLVLKRMVAVKVLHIDPVEAPQALLRLQQEGQAIARLQHPNIVKPYGASVTLDGIPYLVMEVVNGQSLSTILKGGALGWSRTLRIICQICDALAHAHENGVVHRDLKPSNIMIENVGRADEQIKLLDFGIAKITADTTIKATKAGEVFGTPAYMSPEQAEGKPVDARADQYAVGCLLYEMLTGSPPFTGDNALALLMQHCQAKPPCLTDMCADSLPAHVEPVFQQMMEKRPDNRFPTIKEAREALLGSNKYLLRQQLRDWLFNRWTALILALGIVCSVVPLIALKFTNHDKEVQQVAQNARQPIDSGTDIWKAASDAEGDIQVGSCLRNDRFAAKLAVERQTLTSKGATLLGELKNLKDLSLYRSDGVDDKLLQHIEKLPLESLNLGKTSITDAGMESIAKLKHLTTLVICTTEVTNVGCRMLDQLPNLEKLNMSELRITKKTMAVIGRSHLKGLTLDRVPIREGLDELKGLHQLTSLSLRMDHLTNQDLQHLVGLKQLWNLNLEGNDELTDQGVLQATERMTALTYLNLRGTGVSPKAVAVLQKRWPTCKILSVPLPHDSDKKPAEQDAKVMNGF